MNVTIDITIDNTKVPSTVTDFPVYVDLSDMPANFWSTVTNGGGDIRVYRSDGVTECARDVVSCDTATDTGELHFLANSISASVDTVFKIVVDGTSSDYAVGDTYGRNAVWAEYFFVSHDGGPTDSTGTHTPTAGGGVAAGGVTGKLGSATDYDGTDDSYQISNSNMDGTFTVSAWAYADSWQDRATIISKNYDGNYVPAWLSASQGVDWTNLGFGIFNRFNGSWNDQGGSVLPSTGTWVHMVGTLGSSVVRYYQDGVQQGSGDAYTGTNGNNKNWSFGLCTDWNGSPLFPHNGRIDEIRITDITRSEDWITTEYNNQNSPSTFYTATVSGGGGGAVLPNFLNIAGL